MKNKRFAILLALFAAAAQAENVVQLGAYNDQPSAQRQVANAALAGVNAKVQTVQGENGSLLYRVRTDAMDNEQARQTQERLRENNIESLLLVK